MSDGVWIKRLQDCSPGLTAQVGSKMANVAALIQMGVRVPDGFVVLCGGYHHFLAATGLDQVIGRELAAAGDDPDRLRQAAVAIRRHIEATPLPAELDAALAAAYQDLARQWGVADPPVAVRSSAVAEDQADASFAGQYDTVLGVRGAQAVAAAVRRCWASLFTDRAVTYRASRGYSTAGGAMAVGVQKLVNARAAGVMFTINPDTGNPFEMVVEGNWGLGESVVSGLVTPDRFVIRKQDLTVIRQQVGPKAQACYPGPDGVQVVLTPPDMQARLCLAEEEVRELARLGRLLEDHYGQAMDVEWAVDQDGSFPDNVILLQARPVTTTGLKDWQKASDKDPTDHIVDLLLKKRFGA